MDKINKKEKEKLKKELEQRLEQERNKVRSIKYHLEDLGVKQSVIENKSQFNWGIVIIIIGVAFMFLWGLDVLTGPVVFSWIPGLFAIGVIGIGSAIIAGAIRSTTCW